ncbi:hypothetical protein FIV42_22435 [Persicimonas caeni]|uniref:Disintegrin domain-containing protein n=1 Tax=Persicimonas caeni TaxID=2292766 RepID=A0A4Y6PYT8_PERCE|nr:hypothetical protein [Persicimonas caeni]QDG53400.1 hypothetical protein FIV42_22435 [Persicimonas caeni]QED34621.1 hypothetical protein FRD00_22430 [Persicimonas caeni]
MKTFKKLLAILLVSTACSGLIVACGGSEEDDCLSDEDCAAGELCDQTDKVCRFSCETDADCTVEGEVCDTDRTNSGGVCVLGDTEPECTTDDDCAEGETCNTETGMCEGTEPECTTDDDCAEGETCNTDSGMCEVATIYGFAQITDVSDTTNDALCGDSLDDPGSDLYGIELTSADGSSSFWAQWVYDGVNHSTDLASPAGVIDGTAPGLDAEDCPEAGFSDSVVALGCGGSLIVEFVDDQGTAVDILPGDTITVYEYGAQCQTSPSADQDEWSVSICELNEDEALAGNCTGEVAVGSGNGLSDVTVPTDL